MKAIAPAPFSLRLDPKVKARLEEEARHSDRSASYLAAKAIEAFLDARLEKRKAIEQALAEADEGRFVSSQAMAHWMDSWGTKDETPPPEPDILPKR